MRTKWLLTLGLLGVCSGAFAGTPGTFSTSDTLIPVADTADATLSGDTSPSAGSGTIHLDARVYIPDGIAAPAPVIVIIPPYGGSKDSSLVTDIAQDFATQGYVVLTPTLRGFGNSEGLVTFAGPNEINDLKTMILAMQTGVIGDSPMVTVPVSSLSKSGVTGASYGGGQSFEILRTHVAGLTAVAPIIGWTDLYQALAPNDVPKFSFVVGLFASGFDPQNPNYDDLMFTRAEQLLGGNPEAARTGDTSSIDWRSVIFNPAELTVPVFVIQGWRDWLFPAEQATSLFQTSTGIPFFKMYIGGLGHPPAKADDTDPEGVYLRSQLIRWFDYWLKGIDNGIATEPKVTIAPEHTGDWSEAALVTANTFPLPNTTTMTYLINGKTLSQTSSGGRASVVNPNRFGLNAFAPIQNALGGDANALITAVAAANLVINNGSDVLSAGVATGLDDSASNVSFNSAALSQDLDVVGIPQVHLTVAGSASEAYYFVQLLEKLPDGTTHLVSRGAFKDHTVKFMQPHQINFALFGVNHVFASGNKIRLRISSRDFPFFIPNLGQDTFKILHGSRNPSGLALPVVP
jgi:predicted acyl esterase